VLSWSVDKHLLLHAIANFNVVAVRFTQKSSLVHLALIVMFLMLILLNTNKWCSRKLFLTSDNFATHVTLHRTLLVAIALNELDWSRLFINGNKPGRKHGRRKWGGKEDFENFSKKGCFLSFEWEKTSFTTFGSLLEIILKSPRVPTPGENSSDAHGCKDKSLQKTQL